MICDIMLCLLINEILFKIHNLKGVFFQNQTICVTIVTIVLFKLINISLIESSFQPRLDRLGQISWLSLLADHQSLTSRRRTSSLLLLLTFGAQTFFCSQVAGYSLIRMSGETCNLPFSVSHVEGKGRVAVAARQIKVHAFLELVSYLTITFF